MSTLLLSVTLGVFVLGVLLALLTIPILVWMERRVASLIQDRLGPNRTNVGGFRLGGLVQSFADVVKLLLKEEYYPSHIKMGRWLFMIAPMITFVAAFLAFLAIPFADTIVTQEEVLRFSALPIDFGVFWYLAISSIGVLGVIFGGWLSHNKYSLLGAARAGSMVLSYELPLGLSIISFILIYNSVDFNAMVAYQSGTYLGFLPAWGIIEQPLASMILIVALFAETNRNPFTVAEGESEIVAGFMTEYTAMKFALYFMGEYIAMNTASAVIITMVFGGYQLPYLSTETLLTHFSAFATALMIGLPIFIALFILWMRKNNSVREGVIDDGSRAFETKVFTLVLIFMTLFVEFALFYLAFISEDSLAHSLSIALFQIIIFVMKLMLFNLFFVIIRWTVPRFRYDQVQKIGWYYLLPLALINIFITAIVVVGGL